MCTQGKASGWNKLGTCGELAVMDLASLSWWRDPQGLRSCLFRLSQECLGPLVQRSLSYGFPKECGGVSNSWRATAFSIFELGCRMGARGAHVGRERCVRFRPQEKDISTRSVKSIRADTCARIALLRLV